MPVLDIKLMEEKIRKFWEKEKIYKFDLKSKKKIYSIDTPPPTVSGKMHMGHVFSYTQEDFIARYKRMSEGNVFYPFGTDDNGLPTERLIEKLKNVKSKNMPRSEFIKLCLKTLKEITPDFIQDWKNLGVSCDYDILYSTIDDPSRKISQKSFIELYKKGEVYNKNLPTIWCPECQTSIAQAELEDKDLESFFLDIKFSINGKDLIISTTRPELIGACVAIFVNPQDKRYKHLIGKKAKAPLFDFEIPIIADKSADMDKGTGVLMVCSYGDKFDVDAVNRHKLNPKLILNEDGTLNIKQYKGMKIKEARKKILENLKNKGLIKNQRKIIHVVNVHDKCGTEIEFIETEQWFIKILDKKEDLIKLGRDINWHPKHMIKRYENWVNGLEWDWNVSRNRHFGVSIPVWKCEKCEKIILPEDKELPVDPLQIEKKCPKCNEKAKPEDKVLDTWATSSMSPKIASALVNDKIKTPYSLRPQGHDIIRTWAFYTIVKSYLHENKIPWKDVFISGNVTLKGEKMSKSKGNVIEPQEVIEEYGADALRYWASGSKLGDDMDYHEKDVVTGKKLTIKLRSAANFVFMNLKEKPKKPKELVETDKLFLKELDHVIQDATGFFNSYNYSAVKLRIEQFFWRDFADNYIEVVKKRIYQGEDGGKVSAQYTLYKSLLIILKLIAPIMPFVTEEIYQEYFKKTEKDKSIHLSEWPRPESDTRLASHVWPLFLETISLVRREKTKKQKPMNSEIILTLDKRYGKWDRIRKDRLSGMFEDLKNVTNAKEIKEGKFKVEFI